WQYQTASASTRRPSASVLMTSMVWPDIEVTTSPGRCALPSGMFSTRPRMPTALTFALRAASAYIAPTTAAEPPMSVTISSMPSGGFRLMPPVSKQTPLPMKAIGAALALLAPFHWMTTSWLSRALPCPTPSVEPVPAELAHAPGVLLRIEDVGRFGDEVARVADGVGERGEVLEGVGGGLL